VRAFIRLRVDAATRQRESVSDLVQSVCREVLQRAPRFEFRGEAAFRSWLCEAALRKLRDRRDYHASQRRSVRRESAGTGEQDVLACVYRSTFDPLGKLLRAEEVDVLERAFDELSEEQREALTLRKICGLSYAEIAERLGGRNEPAVRQTISRALARLSRAMQKRLDGT
jgi:RNA polymerase sigma-70 factor (ECF subfamily)